METSTDVRSPVTPAVNVCAMDCKGMTARPDERQQMGIADWSRIGSAPAEDGAIAKAPARKRTTRPWRTIVVRLQRPDIRHLALLACPRFDCGPNRTRR